ncbi:hypothetical protein ACMHYB_45010 [Sorangium sp. So ce1128]
MKAKLLRTVSETKEMKFLDMTSPVARNDPAGSSGLATIMPCRKKHVLFGSVPQRASQSGRHRAT